MLNKITEVAKAGRVDEQTLQRMEALKSARDTVRQQVSAVSTSAMRAKTNMAGGMDLEGLLTYYTEAGKSKAGKDTPWNINLDLHNLKAYHSLEVYGRYGADTEVLADKEFEDLPVLDGTGGPYLERERRTGALGLAVLVRHKRDPLTDIAYDKTTPYAQRPLSHICFLGEGDSIRCSLFNMTELPRTGSQHPVSIGDHIIARGVRAHAYQGTTSWEATVVTASPLVLYEEMWNMLDTELQHHRPRNAVRFHRITEAPISKAEREIEWSARRRLSPELKTFLRQKIMVCKWGTTESNLEAECAKRRQVLFDPARFDETDSSWQLVKKENNKPDEFYARMWFDQLVTIMDYTNPDAPVQERVLAEIHVAHGASLRFLPIADPTVFPAIAKAHIPHEDLKFMFWGRPHHEDTYNADLNNTAVKSADLDAVDQKVVISASNSTIIYSNFMHYVLTHGMPLTAEGARLKLAPASKPGAAVQLNSRFHDLNPYNIVSRGDIYNMNEYKGVLDTPFYDDYSFFILFSRALLPFQLEEIAAISPQLQERAEMCTDILLGRPCKNASAATKLQFDKNGIFVIFAIRNEFIATMRAEPDKYNFMRYQAAVEAAHCACDPADDAATAPPAASRVAVSSEAGEKRKTDSAAENSDETKRSRTD